MARHPAGHNLKSRKCKGRRRAAAGSGRAIMRRCGQPLLCGTASPWLRLISWQPYRIIFVDDFRHFVLGGPFVRALAIALIFSVISSASAIAADLGPISPEINPERFGWSGAYVGASVGYAWLSDADH